MGLLRVILGLSGPDLPDLTYNDLNVVIDMKKLIQCCQICQNMKLWKISEMGPQMGQSGPIHPKLTIKVQIVIIDDVHCKTLTNFDY